MKISKQTIRALKRKSEKAFEEVYYTYNNLIYHIIYEMVHDNNLTEELVSDVFVQMYQSIDMFNEDNNFKYWLIQIAKNMTKNKINSLRRENYVLSDELVHQKQDTQQQDYERLMDSIKQFLDPDEFEIINMHILYDYSFKLIAKELGRTTSSVANQYYRALEKIKDIL